MSERRLGRRWREPAVAAGPAVARAGRGGGGRAGGGGRRRRRLGGRRREPGATAGPGGAAEATLGQASAHTIPDTGSASVLDCTHVRTGSDLGLHPDSGDGRAQRDTAGSYGMQAPVARRTGFD
jgi:hypothetical protein